MKFVPIERIAAKLPEAPFYINDMDFPIIVENVYAGLKDMRMVPYKRTFDAYEVKDYKITLPDFHVVHNVVHINSTLTQYEEGVAKVNQIVFKEPESQETTQYETVGLEEIKRYIPHIIGPYIDYTEDGKCLKFKETDITVGVEFNSLVTDPGTGYFLVPEQAEFAIAWYVALQHYTGEFMAGRLDGQRLQYAETKYEEHRMAAKADHRLSQNQMDKLLNTITSFDRKTFGYSA